MKRNGKNMSGEKGKEKNMNNVKGVEMNSKLGYSEEMICNQLLLIGWEREMFDELGKEAKEFTLVRFLLTEIAIERMKRNKIAVRRNTRIHFPSFEYGYEMGKLHASKEVVENGFRCRDCQFRDNCGAQNHSEVFAGRTDCKHYFSFIETICEMTKEERDYFFGNDEVGDAE